MGEIRTNAESMTQRNELEAEREGVRGTETERETDRKRQREGERQGERYREGEETGRDTEMGSRETDR